MAHIARVFAILGVAFVIAMVHSWIVPILTSEPAESEGQAGRLNSLISGDGESPVNDSSGANPDGAQTERTDSTGGGPGDPPPNDAQPSSGGGEGGSDPITEEPIASITLEQVLALYRKHIDLNTGQVVLIDARGQEGAYAEGHIRGAEHMTASMALDGADEQAQQLIAMILPEQTIIIYCGGGDCDESTNLRTVLVGDLGFENVWIFHPGFPALVEAGLPVVSGETPIG